MNEAERLVTARKLLIVVSLLEELDLGELRRCIESSGELPVQRDPLNDRTWTKETFLSLLDSAQRFKNESQEGSRT